MSRVLGILLAVVTPAVAVAALEELNVFSAGAPIKASDINANFKELRAAHEALVAEVAQLGAELEAKVSIVGENVVLYVPDDYPTPHAALATVANKRIAEGASVTIQITESVTGLGPLEITHPDAARIAIRGAGRGGTTLGFTDSGILVRGTRLGLIDGLTLSGPIGTDVESYGLKADALAWVAAGPDFAVKGFGRAYVAGQASVLVVNDSFAEDADLGYSAVGGTILADRMRAIGTRQAVLARYGGFVRARDAVVADSPEGLLAEGGSTIQTGGAGVATELYDPPLNTPTDKNACIFN